MENNNYVNLTPQEEAEVFGQVDMHLVDTLRFVLLSEERKKHEQLLREIQEQKEQIDKLEAKCNALENKVSDPNSLTATIERVVVVALRRQIKGDKEQMARTLGPIIGDALRVQLREDKSDIADALHPVIGNNVSRAVRQSLKQLQRIIDKRLRSGSNFIKLIMARIQGIAPGAMAIRESLPFQVKHVFLIQQDSGLLMAHHKSETEEEIAPGMMSGMLTAIRNFANDAFGANGGGDVDEIQFGEDRVLIEGQEFAYVAAVIGGTEPADFRDEMLDFISDVHIDYRNEIRDYQGGFDPQLDEEIHQNLTEFTAALESSKESVLKPVSPMIMGLSLGMVSAMVLGGVFLTYFIIRLLPYLFIPVPTSPEMVTTEPIVMCVDCDPIVLAEKMPLKLGAVVYNKPNGIQTGSIEAGTIVSIIDTSDKVGTDGDWVRVAWHNETTPDIDIGWIRRSFIQRDESG